MLFETPLSMLEPNPSPVQYSSPLSPQPPCCRPERQRVLNPYARGNPNLPTPIHGIWDHRRIVHCGVLISSLASRSDSRRLSARITAHSWSPIPDSPEVANLKCARSVPKWPGRDNSYLVGSYLPKIDRHYAVRQEPSRWALGKVAVAGVGRNFRVKLTTD